MDASVTNNSSAPRYTAEQWEQHKDLIARLYLKENKRLVDVCGILVQQHAFYATTRSLKHRIRVWHLDKKQKDHEMRAIVGIYLQRKSEGKQSLFRLRGRIIDHSEISRYFRRKGVFNLDLLRPELLNAPPTLPEIRCYTPEPDEQDGSEPVTASTGSDSVRSPLGSTTTPEDDSTAESFVRDQAQVVSKKGLPPTANLKDKSPPASALHRTVPISLRSPMQLQEMECVLSYTKSFLGTNSSWTWTPTFGAAFHDPVHWRNDFLQASYVFRTLGTDLAFSAFSSVYDRIPSLLESHDPAFFAVIVGLLCFPQHPLDFALNQQLFRYIRSMAQVVLGRTHPITLLVSCVLSSDQRNSLAILALEAASREAEDTLGSQHPETLQYWEQLANAYTDLKDYTKVIMYREKLLGAYEATDGPLSPYTCWAIIDLAGVFIQEDRDDEALAYIEKAFERAEAFPPIPRTEIQIRGLSRMAFINEKQGRVAMSRIIMRGSVYIGNELLGSQQIDSVLSKEELKLKQEQWRPFSQEIRESAMRYVEKKAADDASSAMTDRPDVVGLASHLWSMRQGRIMTLQKERNPAKDVNGNSRISRNLLNMFMVQSVSKTTDRTASAECFDANGRYCSRLGPST